MDRLFPNCVSGFVAAMVIGLSMSSAGAQVDVGDPDIGIDIDDPIQIKPTYRPCVQTRCPMDPTRCPRRRTVCPRTATVCPKDKTYCPAVLTRCPRVDTVCPRKRTKCPVTKTVCPSLKTKCPATQTKCPRVDTLCPALKTRCPVGQRSTSCPIIQPNGSTQSIGTARTDATIPTDVVETKVPHLKFENA